MAGEMKDEDLEESLGEETFTSIDGEAERASHDANAARSANARRAIERMRDSKELQDLLADDLELMDRPDHFV